MEPRTLSDASVELRAVAQATAARTRELVDTTRELIRSCQQSVDEARRRRRALRRQRGL